MCQILTASGTVNKKKDLTTLPAQQQARCKIRKNSLYLGEILTTQLTTARQVWPSTLRTDQIASSPQMALTP